MTALNIVNVFSLLVGLFFLFRLLRTLEFSFDQASLGCLMFNVSFPVFYYATVGYVDPVAICVIIAGTCFVYERKWYHVGALLLLGSSVKETTVLLVPVAFGYLFAFRKRWVVIPALLTAVFLIGTILIRIAFGGGSTYYWSISPDFFFANLRLRAILSLILTLLNYNK